MTEKRILVPSAGGPGGVNLARSLSLIDEPVFTVGCDSSRYFVHLAETDEAVLCPPRDPVEPFIDAINRVVDEHGVNMILPNGSLDGEVLSAYREKLHARVFLPGVETFRIGSDKWSTYLRLRDSGLPVPRTWLIEEREDLDKAFSELAPGPAWVRGAGIPGKGVGVASLPAGSIEQAAGWVDFWDGWGKMSVSEYLGGANLTWLGVWDAGRLVCSQGRCRDAYVIPHVSPSGITGAPAVSHTVHRADINDLGYRVCKAIDPTLTGPAFVDFKEDSVGVPKITEINIGRFGTTHNFYSTAGANFPEVVVRLAFGEELPDWVKEYDVLPPDLYWIRNLDCGPVLLEKSELEFP